jgi:hypothetical protein
MQETKAAMLAIIKRGAVRLRKGRKGAYCTGINGARQQSSKKAANRRVNPAKIFFIRLILSGG